MSDVWQRVRMAAHVLRGRPLGYRLVLISDTVDFSMVRPHTWSVQMVFIGTAQAAIARATGATK